MTSMSPEAARDFRRQLQQARENALKDAEAFDGILYVVERLGSFCSRHVEEVTAYKNLGAYQPAVEEVAKDSPLATKIPAQWRHIHMPFSVLYGMVKDARNDALHIGAIARHLTTHTIELSLVLEDALRMYEENKYVSDYMVRDPVCAYLWQPVSFVRQRMLTNSFSYLPVRTAAGDWRLISDLQVAQYLQGCSNAERGRRLARSLEEAMEIKLDETKRVRDKAPIGEVLATFDGKPILVFRDNEETDLVGILTAFDLL